MAQSCLAHELGQVSKGWARDHIQYPKRSPPRNVFHQLPWVDPKTQQIETPPWLPWLQIKKSNLLCGNVSLCFIIYQEAPVSLPGILISVRASSAFIRKISAISWTSIMSWTLKMISTNPFVGLIRKMSLLMNDSSLYLEIYLFSRNEINYICK